MDGDGYKEKTVTVTLGEDDSKDDEKSDDNGDGSGEQSILEDWQNGEEDNTGYEEFFGMW